MRAVRLLLAACLLGLAAQAAADQHLARRSAIEMRIDGACLNLPIVVADRVVRARIESHWQLLLAGRDRVSADAFQNLRLQLALYNARWETLQRRILIGCRARELCKADPDQAQLCSRATLEGYYGLISEAERLRVEIEAFATP